MKQHHKYLLVLITMIVLTFVYMILSYHEIGVTNMYLQFFISFIFGLMIVRVFIEYSNAKANYYFIVNRLKEILAYYESTKEEDWCMFTLHIKDSNGNYKHCALGHVQDKYDDFKYFTDILPPHGRDKLGSLVDCNDGVSDHLFPQETPRQRSIAYIKEAMKLVK